MSTPNRGAAPGPPHDLCAAPHLCGCAPTRRCEVVVTLIVMVIFSVLVVLTGWLALLR